MIASPCILPVLPLVLGASVEGGRKRPFGIILGFVIAFTAFALLSRKLVMLLNINLDVIKYGSLVFLALFGLVLLSGKLSNKFSALTQRFADAGGNLSANAKDGFGSGILIGMFIGLVWTPCAGPILAAILVQVIRQQSDALAFIQVAAFAFGAGLPMLIIALTGRQIMSKLRVFATHTETMRKVFGVIILLAVGFIASGIDPQSLFASRTMAAVSQQAGLVDGLKQPYDAPEFTGLDGWLNSEPLTMASLRGKVVLVDFWTYSCINCIRTLPYVSALDREYRDKGLIVIGIHSPEFEFEKNKDNVKAALAAHGIQYPVALDSKLDTWTAFHNQYWPAHYLIDQQGHVVYTHFGEGHYAETENNIRYLLGLDKKADAAPETRAISNDQTPETYLGYNRGERFASPEDVKPDEAQNYTAPAELPVNKWALSGKWKISDQSITADDAGSSILLKFHAGKVYLVLGTESGKPVKASLTLNGKPLDAEAGKDAPDSFVTVGKYTLYELVSQKAVKDGLLEIKSEQAGLTAYAFTFGN